MWYTFRTASYRFPEDFRYVRSVSWMLYPRGSFLIHSRIYPQKNIWWCKILRVTSRCNFWGIWISKQSLPGYESIVDIIFVIGDVLHTGLFGEYRWFQWTVTCFAKHLDRGGNISHCVTLDLEKGASRVGQNIKTNKTKLLSFTDYLTLIVCING